jgi:DNA-binding NarL/FixJ family response regulator
MAPLRQARILLADDFAPWRGQLRSLLKTHPEWNIVGEASDGREAIEKARELQPDIILLDIGMPFLNGIEAAKIISQSCPKSKILFLTQESDSHVRKAAMRVGAARYLLKANAVHELLEAIASTLDSPRLALSSANPR